MTRIEDLLREEFVGADVPVPGHDAMLARVKRTHRRRVVGATAGGGALLAGVAVAAYAALPAILPGTGLPGAGGVPAGGSVPARQSSHELINTIFTDTRHGYAVQQRCSMDQITAVPVGAPTPDIHQQCFSVLFATADGGHTWKQRPTLPADPATKDAGVNLVPGHSLMFWVDDEGHLALGSWNRRYWTSADGGLTWRESATLRDIGPAGSLATFDPHNRLTFLATQPPGGLPAKDERRLVVPATDGSFWAACPTGGCVNVTRDHGATWRESTVDRSPQVDWVDWVATYDGRTVYASVRSNGVSRLYRSTDGGITWSTVLSLPKPSSSGLVLPNGDLLTVEASEQSTVYRLKAGASTLDRPAGAPAGLYLIYLTGGVVVGAQGWGPDAEDPGPAVKVSTDSGVTWTAIPAPTG
ncbi:MAG: exo-alpha-sialidase [Micromonosporaceae bacterium]|nr:exo-alpha-sialidase [Micromonosporaceae bacterium]